jgi:hypothetical protein
LQQPAHVAASAQEHPLTVAAGTVTVNEQVEGGFIWLLDSIEAALQRSRPDEHGDHRRVT